MKSQIFIFLFFLSFFPTAGQDLAVKRTRSVALGETMVKVNVYENPGTDVTFFAPHFNEQTAIKLAKEAVSRYGGRLVEIESFSGGSPSRRVAFSFNGRSYLLDPNRIYTANGRRCGGFTDGLDRAVALFATEVLKIILNDDSPSLPTGKKFVVAVHNNTDSPDKNAGDLTATAFAAQTRTASQRIFEVQAAGVFLANLEADPDNFVFLATPRHVGFFADAGFNVVLQKPGDKLVSDQCSIDDGSLSVYAGQKNIEYVCLEADAKTGGERQRQMIESVYRLFGRPNEIAVTSPNRESEGNSVDR